jgi:hypothetical protein
MLKNMQDRIK